MELWTHGQTGYKYLTGRIPILATTRESSINEFGVYTEYTPMGSYACKLVEHVDHVDHRWTNGELIQYKGPIDHSTNDIGMIHPVFDEYKFMGKLYEDIWPFNSLGEKWVPEGEEANPEEEEANPEEDGWTMVKKPPKVAD